MTPQTELVLCGALAGLALWVWSWIGRMGKRADAQIESNNIGGCLATSAGVFVVALVVIAVALLFGRATGAF